MLPFTKRPGREETSDVVAKDDVAAKSSPAAVPPASSSRPTTMRPPASGARGQGNAFDEEMTGLRPPVSLQSPHTMPLAAPIPAAGRPASIAPPRSVRPSVRPAAGGPASMTPASMRPPPASARAYEGDDDEDAEDEDGGRTVVRPEGAGKVARRAAAGQSQPPPRQTPSANPTSISPAAVIRKTMESQRSRGLASGPPAELRGDLDHDNDEFTQTAAPSNRVDRTMNSNRSGAQRNYPAPASYEGPPSHRPPPRGDMRADDSGRNPYDSMDDDYGQPSSRSQPPIRTYDAGPSSAPISGPMSGPRSQPPPSSARPGHFASNPPPHSYAPPANGVNPHAATAAMSAVGTGGFHAMPQQHQSVPPAAMSNNAMPAHFRMAQTGAIQGVGGMMMADPPGTSVTSNTRVSGRPAMSWAAALAACGVFVGVVAVAIAQRGDNVAETQAAFVDPAHANKTAAGENPQTPPTQPQPVSNPLPPGLIGASPVQAQPPAMAPVPGMADPSLGALLAPAPPPAAPAPATTTEKEKEKPKTPRFAGAAPARPKPPTTTRAAAGDDDDDKPAKPTKSSSKGSGKGSEADEETRRALEELRKAQLEQSLQK